MRRRRAKCSPTIQKNNCVIHILEKAPYGEDWLKEKLIPGPIERQIADEWARRTEHDDLLGQALYLRRVARGARDGGNKYHRSAINWCGI